MGRWKQESFQTSLECSGRSRDLRLYKLVWESLM